MEEIILYAMMMMMMMLWGVTVAAGGFPTTMELHRAVPATHLSDLSHVLARDRARHGRLLQQYEVHIPVQGNADQFGIYYTRVQIGSPPRDFYALIDTGSSIPWITCSPCSDCLTSTNVPIKLSAYDLRNSSSASLISCWDHRCEIALGTSKSVCSPQTSQCDYRLSYADDSTTSGFFVSDLLHLKLNVSNTSAAMISSIPFFFGCSTTRVDPSVGIVDGIFGFGQSDSSIISQLATEGMTPKVFAHCFRGGNVSGGSLVLGNIMEPKIVYTPLIPSKPFYSIILQSISVNGQPLDINPSVFITPQSQGTIVDSGTTLAYLPGAAFVVLTTAITAAATVSRSAQPYLLGDFQCYEVNSSIFDTFPQVSLDFAGNASWVLSPHDYLQQLSSDSPARWCMSIMKSKDDGIILIGDLLMKDKIIIYDLEAQRIGWVNYDCSLPVNISRIHGVPSRTSKSSFHYWLFYLSIVVFLVTIIAGSLMLLWHKSKELLRKFKDLLGSNFFRF